MTEIIEITSFDGYKLKGKLSLPGGTKQIPKLVLFVNGSGANTYDNRRRIELETNTIEFCYFDFFREKFSRMGIAFFSYNTRGADVDDEPPEYTRVDDELYATYLPSNNVEDIYYMITALKKNERLKNCKVLLLGASEGTETAPLFAAKYPTMADALFLFGYVNDNCKDVLTWQMSGGSSMVLFRAAFETDKKGRVSKSAYDADTLRLVSTILGNASFESLDVNNDGYIDESDFETTQKDNLDAILSAIERGDDVWLKENYPVHLTSAWFQEWINQKSNYELLPTLNLPIYIFHGSIDRNCDVKGVYAVAERFKMLGKKNLTAKVFDLHDHDLNYMQIIMQNKIPVGIRSLLDSIKNIYAPPPCRFARNLFSALRKFHHDSLIKFSKRRRKAYTRQVLTDFIDIPDNSASYIFDISVPIPNVHEQNSMVYSFTATERRVYGFACTVKCHGFLTDVRITDSKGKLLFMQCQDDFSFTGGLGINEGLITISIKFYTNYEDFMDYHRTVSDESLSDEALQYLNDLFSRDVTDYSANVSIQIW